MAQELTKTDVQEVVERLMKTNAFKNAIRNIVAASLRDLFRALFQKDGFWKSEVVK